MEHRSYSWRRIAGACVLGSLALVACHSSEIEKSGPTGGPSTTEPPRVVTVTPPADDVGVPPGINLSVTFNVRMDPDSFDNQTFTLSDGSEIYEGSISYSDSAKKATFDPAANLANGTTYTASLNGVKSASGVPMLSHSWSFTTQ